MLSESEMFSAGWALKPWKDVNAAFIGWIDDKFGEFRTDRRADCTQTNLQTNNLQM